VAAEDDIQKNKDMLSDVNLSHIAQLLRWPSLSKTDLAKSFATNFGKKNKLIQNLNINLIKKEFDSSHTDDVDKVLTDI